MIKSNTTLSIFIKTLVWTTLIVSACLFLNFISSLILPFVIAFFISYILNSVVDRLEFVFQRRIIAVIFLYLVFFIGLVFFFNIVIPLLVSEFNDLMKNFPYYSLKIQEWYQLIVSYINVTFPYIEQIGILSNFQTQIQALLFNTTQHITTIFLATFSTLSYAFLIPIILFFFLYQGPELKLSFFKLVPNKYFEVLMNLFYQIGIKLGNYLRGIFVETVIVGCLTASIMLLLDVNYSIILALIVCITNIIPYLGPVIGAIPALVIFYLQVKSLNLLCYLILGIIFVQLVDNILLKPIIYSQSVDLHPLLVLFFLLFGGYIAGIWGLILAVPVVGIIKVTVSILKKEIRFRLHTRGNV